MASDQLAQDFTAQVIAGSAGIFYIHPDHLNTPRLITNQAQQVVWRWDQGEPFGNNLPNENPSELGTFTCNLRLPGQYFDKETNLHYNYFRDYDPAIGRYIQSDPIGLLGGVNTYAYVDGNPISRADPLGLEWQFTVGVSGSIGGNPALPILSPFIGGGLSVGFTTSGQIIVQTQATGSLGVGIYGGVGVQGQVSRSNCPTPSGMSVQQAFQGDFNFGAGPSVGGSIQYDPTSGGAGVQSGLGRIGQGRLGVGYGLQTSAGITQTTTLATPALFPSKPAQNCGCQ